MQRDLTKGSIPKGLFRFALPYLLSTFLQTFYGLADLFITGQFNGAASISGVSIGSQLMHMVTVIIVGLAMGTTVLLGRAVGAKDQKAVSRCIGNTVTLFAVFSVVLTIILSLLVNPIIRALSTPAEAVSETRNYMLICFTGIIFITAYNVISGIFRGLGDTTTPMIFVAIAGVLNIGLDYLMIGPMHMGARGAALATVLSQVVSVIFALTALIHMGRKSRARDAGQTHPQMKGNDSNSTQSGTQQHPSAGKPAPQGSDSITDQDKRVSSPAADSVEIRLCLSDLIPDASIMKNILGVGVPVACQDGFIQISFLVITAIANSRGVEVAAAVGIVEKIISFLFLVPSAMLGTVSAFASQNNGAGLHERSRKGLFLSMRFCVLYGIVIFILCQFLANGLVSLFVKDDPEVVILGGQYLRSYSADVIFAGIHFCFSGYFSAYGKSIYSFVHNILSVTCVRIPGAWLASKLFPDTLYPMGWAPPLGSLLSVIICIFFYRHLQKSFREQVP